MLKRILTSPAIAYAVLALLAFPITELILFREDATHFVHDVLDNELPVFTAFADDLARGNFSLWNPDLTAGNARFSQTPSPPATPEVWLGIVLPAFDAYLLGYALLIWVAGYGMHRFLRDALGLPVAACLVGGAMYAFSFWHYVMGFSIAMLPMLLWLTDRFLRAEADRRLVGVGLAAFTGASLWIGHPQLFEFAALVQLGYVVVVAGGRGTLRRDLLAWSATWVIAALLFAPPLLTQLTHLADSQRAIWDLDYLYPGMPGDRALRALEAYRLLGVGLPLEGFGPSSPATYGTWFAGGVGLPLLLASAFVPRPDARSRYLLAVMLAIPVLDLAATVAAPYMDALGPLGSFQLIRVRHLVPFAVAANVAFALAVLLRGSGGLPRRPLVLGAAGAGVAIIVAQLIEAATREIDPSTLSSAGWTAARAGLGLGLAGSIVLVLAVGRVAGPRWLGPVLVTALVMLTVGDRAAMARAERLLTGQGLGTWTALMAVDPARAFIRDHAGEADRVLTVGLPTEGAHPNAMALAGLHDAGGYQTTYPLAYHAFLGTLTDPFLEANPELGRYFHGWGNRAYAFGAGLDPELLDLAGVRWIYARGVTLDTPGLAERQRWEGVTVYENLDPFPRATVVPGISAFATTGELNAALAVAEAGELAATAYVLEADLPGGWADGIGDGGGEPAAATITTYGDDLVRVRADATAPSILVLTDTWDPGWTAAVDGMPAEIVRAYGTFRGVGVPAGTSEVTFAYRPVETYAGFALAGATGLGLVVWTVLALRGRRRVASAGVPRE